MSPPSPVYLSIAAPASHAKGFTWTSHKEPFSPPRPRVLSCHVFLLDCVNSAVICRYDRPDDLTDEEAVLAGYCNPQYESVEGAIKAGMRVCGSVGNRTAKRWAVSRWVEERIVWPLALLPVSSAARAKADAARGRLSFFFKLSCFSCFFLSFFSTFRSCP